MTMKSITDIARQFNRTVLYCRGLQERFGVAIYEGSAYSNAYVAWFKTIIHLRSLGISEDALLKLWNLEKKILQLLQIDAVESPTWYLDSCGKKLHRRRRLLLTNYDIKFTINANKLQLGINFHPKPVELFNGTEMGEDVLNVLQRYREQYRRIVTEANTESRQLASAAGWGRTLRAE